MTIYMAVTADEYELPVAISESATELGRILGVSENTIFTAIRRKLSGKKIGLRFEKIVIDDEEMLEE